jgi:hypothetical protein
LEFLSLELVLRTYDPRQPLAMTTNLATSALRSDGRTHRDSRSGANATMRQARTHPQRQPPGLSCGNGLDPDHKVAMPGNLVATDFDPRGRK